VKFERLYLKAFGAFQDRVIDLPRRGAHDLHFVYGPNEAGKSTLLRAVTAFLFDIPERTSDAFLHDYNALRIGAVLALQDGSRMSVMRRKARKTKLFGIDEATGAEVTDRPLPEDALADLLQGLDLANYRNLFALDIMGLEQGSAELLRGEGEVGRSLFQAAAGVASLRGLLDALDEEASQIFKPRGSTSRLNRVLGELEDGKRKLRNATVRTTAWETARHALESAARGHAEVRAGLRDVRGRLSQLQRVAGNLPLLAERHAKLAELGELAHIPELAPEAALNRATAQERLRQATDTQRAAAARLEDREAELRATVVRTDLLERAAAVEQVFHTIASYRDARDAIPRLQREHEAHEEALRRLFKEVGAQGDIATASTLLPDEVVAAQARALMEEHARLDTELGRCHEQLEAAESERDKANIALAELPAPLAAEALANAAAEYASLGDQEDRGRELDLAIAQEAGSLQRGIASIWSGGEADWLALTPPLIETVTDFEKEFTDLREQERVYRDKVGILEGDLDDRQRELDVLAATGEAITQTEVVAARTARDATWKELRELRLDGNAPPAAEIAQAQYGRELAANFEAALREADRLADLLRADTARATRLESTRARIQAMREALAALEVDRSQRNSEKERLEQRWQALLAPYRLSGITPAAFREWMTQNERLVSEHARLEAHRLEREQVATKVMRGRSRLDAGLRECGLPESTAEESGKGLLLRAKAACSAAARDDADRRLLADRVARAAADLAGAMRRLDRTNEQLRAWRDRWAGTARALGLPADAMPVQAGIRLEQFAGISSALGEIRQVQAELAAHRRTVEDFTGVVDGLVQHIGEAAQGRAPDELIARLYGALTEARTQRQRQLTLNDEVDREKQALRDAGIQANQAREMLQGLVAVAGCAHEDDLPAVEIRFARKQTLQARLREIDELLVKHNARPVEEVVQQAGALTLDDVEQDRTEREAEIETLDIKVDEAHGRLVEARQEFEAIDGTAAAAEAQQEVLSLAARAATEARRYARLRLASTLLARVIQAYREENQGPLLRRASTVFARITLGSFCGLVVDYESDQQVLLGLRPSGERVAVAGMSQGTRDQLFLSLRIAAIEQHIESRGPFPVIVDDLLVQFDDARAMATLEVLGEMSTRTQVLFFTHHGHLVELAEASPLGKAICVQRL
jgi:exonuclease SbcC